MAQADKVDALQTSEEESMTAVLFGARLPGVGPVTARRMVNHYGSELGSVMDAPDAARRLAQVKGIGIKSAARIKAAWDNSRGRPSHRCDSQWLPRPRPTAACVVLMKQHQLCTVELTA